MSDKLPENLSDWRQAAKRNDIWHAQSLAAGTPLASGSKFKFEHFLRIRVLYLGDSSPVAIAESQLFSQEKFDKMKSMLESDTDAAFLKTFLQGRANIQEDWNAKKAKKCGKFAAALEHLHLIVSRNVREMTDSEDISDQKILPSPVKTRSMTQPGIHHHEGSLRSMCPTTPTPVPRRLHTESLSLSPPSGESPPSGDIDLSRLSLGSREETSSPPDSDLRRAMDIFERSRFSPGDEQTVNTALVTLIIALSWVIGYVGRVHHDRARFSIRNDAETDLYVACVDGLIMELEKDNYNAFMEVKRDLRGDNSSARRQIAAQMAAFIFQQDVVLPEKVSKTEMEKGSGKAAKGKGKDSKVAAKEDGGNQKK